MSRVSIYCLRIKALRAPWSTLFSANAYIVPATVKKAVELASVTNQHVWRKLAIVSEKRERPKHATRIKIVNDWKLSSFLRRYLWVIYRWDKYLRSFATLFSYIFHNCIYLFQAQSTDIKEGTKSFYFQFIFIFKEINLLMTSYNSINKAIGKVAYFCSLF